MSVKSLRFLSESLRTERDRYLDLRIDLRAQDLQGQLHSDAEKLLSVGGQWDRSTKSYTASGQKSKILGLHTGQVEAARWIVRWFHAKVAGSTLEERGRPVYSLLLHGGRRAGKTDLGVKAGACYALFRPRSFVWLISENIPKTEELETDIRGWLPQDWYEYRGAPWNQFQLANGSMIWLRSAHDPDALKRGRCDFAVLNEAQNMSDRAFATVRAATADNGGLTVLAANPPENPVGFWVEKFFEEARAGKRPAKEFHLDATQNPHIDHASLDAMKDEVDERTYRREILGEFLPRIDVVFHAWSNGKSGNVQPKPELPTADITKQFTRARFFREFDCILGLDFQLNPYPCAVELRAYLDPEDPNGEPLLWMTNYVTVEDGYEEDLSNALLERGYSQERTILIPDASGAFQGIDRKKKVPSFDLLKLLGWRHIYKPDENMDKNPRIAERVACANALMKNSNGKRRLFSTPENLELNEAIKLWQNRNGVPYRRSPFAHLCDAATYPLWRLYPRHVKPPQAPPKAGSMKSVDVRPRGPRTL